MTESTPPPAEPGPVVVGFDGTTSGEDALALARWCGRVLGAPLVVTVVHPAPPPISPARVDAEWVADRHRLAEKVLDEARRLLAGAAEPVEYRVVASSSAAHGLHDLAEELGAAVIVVGSRSTGPEERLFAGSTADRLLSGSVAPVAVAPSGLRNRQPVPVSRIGVAYIDTPDGHRALDMAARVALRVNAALRLYTVVAEEAEVVLPVIGRDAEDAFHATARESSQQALDLAIAGLQAGLDASGQILGGEVVAVLSDLDDVDVLFCGSRGYGPARRVLLGGVSSRLMRRARCPLIVVPRGS